MGMCVRAYVYVDVYVCMFVYMYVYGYMYCVCVCVCLCMCARVCVDVCACVVTTHHPIPWHQIDTSYLREKICSIRSVINRLCISSNTDIEG
jgi:hypothetical protein